MATPSPITVLNVTALVTVMLSMGLQVRLGDLLASVRPVHLLVLGLLANYVLVPLVTVGLLLAFRADPLVAAGFFILAACPGAPVGPPITAVAGGHVPCSIGMMLILAGLSAVLSPALLELLLARVAPGTDLRVDSLAVVRILLMTQLLPLLLGLGIHHLAPRLTLKVVRPVGVLSNVLLLGLVGLIVAEQFATLAAIRPRAWMGMSLLLLASLCIGWICGGPSVATRKALATTTAIRNVAVGLTIALSNFKGTPAVTAVVAYGLLSILGAMGFAFLFSRFGVTEPKRIPIGS